MSKRCCAKNCFNSVQYNRNVAYFSFPKNNKFAHRWAELAGRPDIMEKPLSRIVKYYLCSEHFTANCFLDKNTRQILKRNLPHSIALPSIFKNNLQETMQNANPIQSIEVHNIVLLNVDEEMKESKPVSDENTLDRSSQKSITLEGDETAFFTYDDAENQFIGVDHGLQDIKEKILRPTLVEELPLICRLCCNELKRGEPVLRLGDSVNLKEFIGRVMHNQVRSTFVIFRIIAVRLLFWTCVGADGKENPLNGNLESAKNK